MKNKLFRSIARIVPVVLIGLSTFSCKDMFDIEPETTLDAEQMYQNIYDADAAVIGVYGKFLNLAERHVVLNELRADLLNVTANAASEPDLLQLNYHSVTEDNKYANPRPYYEVIINCNDVLHNFEKMLDENKITREQFNHRYSDIAALRSWVYLQLGIQFGMVPYFTEPLANVNELKDQSKFRRIEFNELLDKLLLATDSIPHKDIYPAGSSLIVNLDGYSSQKFFINKRLVLGDLHLWKGNYNTAARHYREIMETGAADASRGARFFEQYRVGWQAFSHGIGFNGAQTASGANSSVTVWNYEWIWDLPFSERFSPTNPFIRLFANAGGNYLLKPSQLAIDNWANGTRNDGVTPGDPRANGAVRTSLGQPVVGKYLQNFNPTSPFQNQGNWFLARAALVHLRFAEAANREGHHQLAQAFLQKGIAREFGPDPNGTGNLPAGTDVTFSQQTFLPAPYNFDARNGQLIPFTYGPWYRHSGLRTRAGVQNLNFDDPFATDPLMIRIENALIEEAALELAFEGHRWQDLLRIALRRDDPAFLAEKVYEKLVRANDPRASEVRATLMNKQNWYLPFRMD